jgi:hypothetical protein
MGETVIDDVFDTVPGKVFRRRENLRPGLPKTVATTTATPMDLDILYRDSSSAFLVFELKRTDRRVMNKPRSPWTENLVQVPPQTHSSGRAESFGDYVKARVREFAGRMRRQRAGQPRVDAVPLRIRDAGAVVFRTSVRVTDPMDYRVSRAAVFQEIEPLESLDEKVQALLAELEHSLAVDVGIVARLRALEFEAREDGEPFSVDALEAFTLFARAEPNMSPPDLTLGPNGELLSEWRRREGTIAVYFVNPVTVQYLVKTPNPAHEGFQERYTATTTVDRLLQALKRIAPFSLRA